MRSAYHCWKKLGLPEAQAVGNKGERSLFLVPHPLESRGDLLLGTCLVVMMEKGRDTKYGFERCREELLSLAHTFWVVSQLHGSGSMGADETASLFLGRNECRLGKG